MLCVPLSSLWSCKGVKANIINLILINFIGGFHSSSIHSYGKIMWYKQIISCFGLAIFVTACHQPESSKEEVSKLEKEKVSGAVSCTATGLPVQDSALYMSGGGSEFQPTEFGDLKVPVKKIEGMVWIPGGEFSMGGVNPIGMMDGGSFGVPPATTSSAAVAFRTWSPSLSRRWSLVIQPHQSPSPMKLMMSAKTRKMAI